MKKATTIKPKTAQLKRIGAADPWVKREGGTKRTHGHKWRVIREKVLVRDNYVCQCQECKASGEIKLAHEVDHIKPLSDGGTDALWNLQAINRDCHIRKSLAEAANNRATMHPEWLPNPFAKPVLVLVGPPASGKTTKANAIRKPDDLVIDLDVLSVDLFTVPMWKLDQKQRAALIRERNSMIADYLKGRTSHARLILIATESRLKGRKWWKDRGATVEMILRPISACVDSIMSRDISDTAKSQQCAVARKWG